MTRFFSALLFLLLTLQGLAQDYKRTFNWYFGDSAAISFANLPPTPLSNSSMGLGSLTYEGCATISDTNGSLLFYTNGRTVWNKNHQVMMNGNSIFGHQSSTQSSIILPQPGNDSLYYLFTTDALGGNFGLRYSIININKQGGLGEVVQKNTLLITPVCEKLTATYHANGKDYWILTHGFYNNLFYAYRLTAQGVKLCPVVSAIGSVHYTTGAPDAQGAMKLNKSGDRLAITLFDPYKQYVELFKFNKVNGEITDIVQLPNILPSYGIEFSPSSNFLYVSTTRNYLFQYNLSLGTAAAIRNSQIQIYWADSIHYLDNIHTSIQLGPDNRIYIALVDSNFLSVIEHPDSAGLSCGFQLNGFQLASGKTSQYGLPNFVTSYFNRDSSIDFSYRFLCPTPQAVFTAKFAVSPQWTIRKQNSTASWSYNVNTITHTFDTGTFEVKLKSGTDSISKIITVSPTGQLIIPTDTLKCQVDSITLTPQNAHWYSCIAWNDTLSVTAIAAKKTGMYKVTAWTTHGCKLSDTIGVRLYKTPPDPLVKPMPDTLYFCKEKSVVLSPDSGSSFVWNDGLTLAQRTVDTTGLFYTHWMDSFTCVRKDTVRLLNFSYAYSHTLPDTVKFCKGTSVILKSDSGNAFTWNDGHLNATRRIDTAGLFHSHWTDSNTCAQSDTSRLLFYPVTPLQKPLPDSIMFCMGKAVTLNPDSGSNFIWNDGIVTARRVVDNAGVFFTAWNDINGCQMADTILVKTYSVAKPTIQRTGDSLFASGNFAQWQWLLNDQPVNGAVQNRYKALQNGWYKVWASDTGLCVAVSDSVNITNVLVNEQTLADAILVFPNPVTGTLYINSTTYAPVTELALYNVTGQRVLSEKNSSKNLQLEINCTALPKGIYFLELTTLNQMTCRKKILIR